MKFFVTLLLLLPTITLAASDLPIRLAHKNGFTGCDSAINEAFAHTNGDVRVNISIFPESKKDAIKLTATSGSQGDSIYVEAEFRKIGATCIWTETNILTTDKNCIAYKEEMSAFKFIAQSSDFTWTENKGGVNLILKSVGSGCMAIYQVGKTR